MKPSSAYLWALLTVFETTHITATETLLTKLTNQLLDGYDPSVRPYCPPNQTQVKVFIDVALRQLISLDEPSQILKLNLWIRLRWNDCLLTWNPADYGNITSLTLPFQQIWKPDVLLFDSVSEEFYGFLDYRAYVRKNGTISYNFPTTLELQCPLDITNFPYDRQICTLTFGSWSYDLRGINMFFMYQDSADLTYMQKHVEWTIVKVPAERRLINYSNYDYSFVDIAYFLYLQRKPGYYEANIILPSVVITLVGAFGFILPVDSGEKVSLEVTVLLSQTVFQLLVADKLPPSADANPWLGQYFSFTLYLGGFTILAQALVVNIYYREDKEMPKWLKKYILIPLLFITCKHRSRKKKEELVEMDNATKWQLMSVCVDRLTLGMFIITVTAGFGYILYKLRIAE